MTIKRKVSFCDNQKESYIISVPQENVENSTEGTNTKEGPNTTEEDPIEPRGGATAAVLQPQARRSARSSVSMYAEGLAPQDLANISSPVPSQVIDIPRTLFYLILFFLVCLPVQEILLIRERT